GHGGSIRKGGPGTRGKHHRAGLCRGTRQLREADDQGKSADRPGDREGRDEQYHHPRMTHGFFLAVEGPEGAGKSTLVSSLAVRLRQEGTEPLLVREPGGTEVAEAIRRILLEPESNLAPISELYLFLAARADLVARRIRPAIEAGNVVVADRFELSTIAY